MPTLPTSSGRSMNYKGTRRRGHDLAFHSVRDALFASGLPFLVSINDVPEAWELYSRAGSITRLCSGKNSSKPELLALHQGNPAVWPEQSCCRSRIEAAILSPQQDCQGRTRPAPEQSSPQARTRLQSDFAFPSFCALFGPKERAVTKR